MTGGRAPRGRSASDAIYRAKNRERIRASSAARYAANAERGRARSAAYRKRHPERAELARAYLAAWQRANRERVRGYGAAYRATHREEQRARGVAYRAAHRDQKRESEAAYRRAYPEKNAHRVAARRARKHGNGGSHTLAEWQELVSARGGICAYCGEAKPLERDHNIPLIRGGTDDITNIVPACRSCNSKKGTRTTAEYLETVAERQRVKQ